MLVREVGVTLPQALRMATAVPAAASARRPLRPPGAGLPADLVHLDADLALRGVWRAGGRCSDVV